MTLHQPGIAVFVAALLLIAPPAMAKTKAAAKPQAAAKSETATKPKPESAQAKAPGAKLLLDAWYTITLNSGGIGGPIRYGYYNDHLESRDGKLFFQNR